ncbi:MAG TPA: hypothetical protein VIH59_22285 [Candidatus Tectomicrobia bacterium]
MGFYADGLALVSYALRVFTGYHTEFAIALVIAIVLAAGCWLAASNYSRLWNLRFRTMPGHHILCLGAAVCTLIFALVFASLKYTKQAADLAIDQWKVRLLMGLEWSKQTYRTAYYEVKALGFEDFRNVLPPEQGGRIPLNHASSIKKFAAVYANAAVHNFQVNHPFLSRILSANSVIPAGLIDQKVTEFFRLHPGGTYPAEEAINIAAVEIKHRLQTQTARVVPMARIILVTLFLIAQLVPFGIIGYAAYRDLKVTT